jgi:metal-responsive CopG/Arc/MetJ family transcriptional regulator
MSHRKLSEDRALAKTISLPGPLWLRLEAVVPANKGLGPLSPRSNFIREAIEEKLERMKNVDLS